MNFLSLLNLVLKDESGATAVEYGLIVGLIFLVIVGGVASLGQSMDASYTNTATQLTAAL